MSFICPLYKGELEKEIPAQIPQSANVNLIINEYDGEVLEKAEAQRTRAKCYKKEYPSITFPDKLTDEETLTNEEWEENQDVFEEETLSHAEELPIT